MSDAKTELRAMGVHVPDILVPADHIDLEKWAVVACDQYTSQREYWDKVDAFVGAQPSTLRLTFPEVYLEDPHPELRIESINRHMREYLSQEVFQTYPESLFLVHRQVGHGPGRWGLLVALDLEFYDYSTDSKTYIRATEGTIVSRIPPRKLIRKDAPLELPHILVLINDPGRLVIEPLALRCNRLAMVYDTKLMMGGGSVTAYRVTGEAELAKVAAAFRSLHADVDPSNPLLFAMGDGNHSLATAKSCWEDVKATLSESQRHNHPARFALVELENIYDPGLVFEPIHRVLFNIERTEFFATLQGYCGSYEEQPFGDVTGLMKEIHRNDGVQRFGYVDSDSLSVVTIHEPAASIAAGTLQMTIDSLVSRRLAQVDYIHGTDVTESLGKKKRSLGLFLPAIAKETFFQSIVKDGALPRKTFSMGEAHEKRFYLEARRIVW